MRARLAMGTIVVGREPVRRFPVKSLKPETTHSHVGGAGEPTAKNPDGRMAKWPNGSADSQCLQRRGILPDGIRHRSGEGVVLQQQRFQSGAAKGGRNAPAQPVD